MPVTVDGLIPAIYIVQVTVTDSAARRAALMRDMSDGIAILASRHRCSAARRVHHSGISLGHLQILWILQEHGPLPVSRLADWLGIGVPNATGLLDRMEQRGLVERVRDATDRRIVMACQTELGRETVRDVDGWRSDLVEEIFDPLTTAQLATLADHLRAVALKDRPARDVAPGAGGEPPRGDPAR